MGGVASRRLTEHGRERKQQLLDCAGELFATKGYANTRIADICDAAGVAKGLFYWYFENKEALFVELVRSMRLRLRHAQADGIDPAADPLTQIRQGAEASVRFIADRHAFFALLEVEQHAGLPSLLREGAAVHASATRALIEKGQEAGLVRAGDAYLLALGIVGAVAFFSRVHRVAPLSLDVGDLSRFVGDWVTAALT
jgi:AcrR family transcriptional regulator